MQRVKSGVYQSNRWARVRQRVAVRDRGQCSMCGTLTTTGRTLPHAAVIDHITPHRGDPHLFWDERNVWLVCKSCHDGPCRSIEREGGDIAERKRAWRSEAYDKTGRPTDPAHPWNA